MPFYKLFLVLVCSFVICNTSPFNSFYLHILSTFGKWMQWPTSLLRFHPSYDIRSGNRTLFRGTFCFLFLLFRYVVQRPSSVSFAECSNFLYVGGNLAVGSCEQVPPSTQKVSSSCSFFALCTVVYPFPAASSIPYKLEVLYPRKHGYIAKRVNTVCKCLPPKLALLYPLDVQQGGRARQDGCNVLLL